MKGFFRRMLPALILGAVGAAVLAAYTLLRRSPAAMAAWLQTIAMGWGRRASGVCAVFGFSVAELCWTLGVLGLILFVVLAVRAVWRSRGRRWRVLGCRLLALGCAGVFIWAGYTAFWGVGYLAPSFYSAQTGLEAKPVSVEQLQRTTALFAQGANYYADQVARDETGLFSEDLLSLFSRTDSLYTQLEQQFPALAGPVRRAKPMFYSPLMSALGFTGFYFPFTGEANVNIHSPGCMVPATIAHELAHQRGVVFEDEANFTGIAACLSQPDPVFRYSACLMGYIHLANALLAADAEAWEEISGSLNQLVLRDLEDNNAFWARYDTPVSDAAEGVYEGFLQSHGEERGMQSYGACVDLLVAFYQDADAL